MGIKQDKPKL